MAFSVVLTPSRYYSASARRHSVSDGFFDLLRLISPFEAIRDCCQRPLAAAEFQSNFWFLMSLCLAQAPASFRRLSSRFLTVMSYVDDRAVYDYARRSSRSTRISLYRAGIMLREQSI